MAHLHPFAVAPVFAGRRGGVYLCRHVGQHAPGDIADLFPLGYYPTYLRSSDGTGFLRLIRTVWKLDPQSDLNLGGMFMWIIGGLLYFASLLAVISRLFRRPEEQETEEKGFSDAKQR